MSLQKQWVCKKTEFLQGLLAWTKCTYKKKSLIWKKKDQKKGTCITIRQKKNENTKKMQNKL